MRYLWLLIIPGVFFAAERVARLIERLRLRLSPTQPGDPDEVESGDRPDSGADEEYGDDLRAMWDHEEDLRWIAEEHSLDLLDQVDRAFAEELHTLRLAVEEDIRHFSVRVFRIIDEWEPGWRGEPSVPLPDFAAVHCLIDDTREMAAVA